MSGEKLQMSGEAQKVFGEPVVDITPYVIIQVIHIVIRGNILVLWQYNHNNETPPLLIHLSTTTKPLLQFWLILTILIGMET